MFFGNWLADWRFYALLSAIFASLTAILGKVGVTSINSNLATLIRTFVIVIFTAAIVAYKGEWQLRGQVGTKGALFLVLSGLATGASWLCYYRALQLGPASKVAPVDKLSVVLTVLLAALFLGESITLKTFFAVALIAAGSTLLVL